jgi:copper(I)-binding protein
MKERIRVFMFMLLVIFTLSGCSVATGIDVSSTWARPAMQGNNGAVYFLLQNHSAGKDELTGISSTFAEAVEIHESQMAGDVMQMRQVTSLPIHGKESILFGPGGYHAMLVGLKQELKPGEQIQVSLHFENHEDILLTVPVQEIAPGEAVENH